MTIRICITIPPRTVSEALFLIDRAENEHADFIEVRLDYLNEPCHLTDLLNCHTVPLIGTNRSTQCQGGFSGSENKRKELLIQAAMDGFEYVDIELSTPKLVDFIRQIRDLGAKTLVSFHDFKGTPTTIELDKILKRQIESGADICKIVTTANTVEDNLKILNFVSKACEAAETVCFSMGDLGKLSRVMSPIFGGFFTMAALQENRRTAPGQLTILEMRSLYETMGF